MNRIWLICSSALLLLLVVACLWRLWPAADDWQASQMLREGNAVLRAQLAQAQEDLNAASDAQLADQPELEELEREYAELTDLPARTAALEQQYADDIRMLEDAILDGSSDARIAYLTFDDGPYAGTPQFLEILADKQAPATFFVLGKEKYAEIYRAEYAAGHNLANHTYSHQIRDGIYRSADAFMADVEKLSAFLETTVGVRPSIVRFPGGTATAGSQRDAIIARLSGENYGYVDWDAVTGDGTDTSLTPERAYQNAMNSVAGRDIVVLLMHDYNSATLGALPDIIDGLREQGYLLLPLYASSVKVKGE